MIIRVDRSICAGHALCAAKAPELYELDEDGYCISDGRAVPAELAEQARLGASFCPERAITLEGAAAAAPAAKRPTIRFRQPNGKIQEVEAMLGLSLMRVAQDAGLNGIIGECGGSCSCATCHVYVEGAQADALPSVSSDEDAMLDGVAAERRPNSRLGCQLDVTAALDGLIVEIPDCQT